MITTTKIHPHDVGLPAKAIRKRRRSRRLAKIMLGVAAITGIPGWTLFGSSILSAIHMKDQPPSLAIIAYGVLIISSVTLVLGLWYMLLAQVERVARMVDAADLDPHSAMIVCPSCHHSAESSDRFCRHCGNGLPHGHDSKQ